MIGYRDTAKSTPHMLRLDGLTLTFGSGGILWNPTDEQVFVLERTATRKARFERTVSQVETDRPKRSRRRIPLVETPVEVLPPHEPESVPMPDTPLVAEEEP